MQSDWIDRHLVCPRDRTNLERRGESVSCKNGHIYPIVQGIPVLLLDEAEPTNPVVFSETKERVETGNGRGEDPEEFVAQMALRTCGNLYTPLMKNGGLKRFPIPEIRLPPGDGKFLLDVGCNWGRWSVAASRKGYQVIGMDPNLNALIANRKVAEEMGAETMAVCGDARYMPFADNTFDTVYSYGVLQHFAKDAARQAMKEMARVGKPDATVLVQMANKYGIRQIYQRTKRLVSGHKAGNFVVRPWGPNELREAFQSLVGPARVFVDGFFNLNPQATDRDLMPKRYAAVINISEALRQVSDRIPLLGDAADSLYIQAENRKAFQPSS